MPLTTAQALAKWEGVVSMLAAEKAHAAAHPDQQVSPAGALGMVQSLGLATQELSTPAHTWKVLLQKQVPRRVLAGCSELAASCPLMAACVAEMLAAHAALPLRTAPPGSSTSRFAPALWEQVEQSGFLPQLPGMLSSQVSTLQARMADAAHMADAAAAGPLHNSVSGVLLNVLASLNDMQPLETHAAGLQCLVPAMQLVVLSMQHVSKALSQSGRQPWMANVPGLIWSGVAAAGSAAAHLLHDSATTQQAGASSGNGRGSGSGSRGGSSQQAVAQARAQAVKALLQAEATMQCFCLAALAMMLVQHLQQAGTPPGNQWLPAALAPSLPAAYTTMLEQLGCSREVGLWVADVLNKRPDEAPAGGGQGSAPGGGQPQRSLGGRSSDPPSWVVDGVLTGLGNYSSLLDGFDAQDVLPRKQLAPLQLSVPAITLQWVLETPPATLLHMGIDLRAVCAQAARACSDGLGLVMQHQWQWADLQPGGALQLLQAGSQTVAVLGTAVLDKLLGMCRDSGGTSSSSGRPAGSTTNASSRSSSAAVQGDRDTLLQCCRYVVEVIARELAVEAEVEHLKVENGAASIGAQQLPVGCAQLCKLLQECVRLSASGAAPLATVPLSGTDAASTLVGGVLEAVHALMFTFWSGNPVWDRGGPLVAYVAAAGDPGSPEALELFGLLCSVLKAVALTPIMHVIVPLLTKAVCAGAYNLLQMALRATQAPAEGSESSSISSSGSACAVALPWLVLIGRGCLGCAALVQHWQRVMDVHGEGSAAGSTAQYMPSWTSHRREIAGTLDYLQGSLAEAAAWLAAAGPAQQLAALGYQPLDLQQQLAAAAGGLPALCRELEAINTFSVTPAGARSTAAVLKAIQEHLLAAARALSTFAIPHACNNPRCVSVSLASEARLVGGRRCICAGCRTARYCGRDCQGAAWRAHKPVCKALAAAAASAGAAAATAGHDGTAEPAASDSRAAD